MILDGGPAKIADGESFESTDRMLHSWRKRRRKRASKAGDVRKVVSSINRRYACGGSTKPASPASRRTPRVPVVERSSLRNSTPSAIVVAPKSEATWMRSLSYRSNATVPYGPSSVGLAGMDTRSPSRRGYQLCVLRTRGRIWRKAVQFALRDNSVDDCFRRRSIPSVLANRESWLWNLPVFEFHKSHHGCPVFIGFNIQRLSGVARRCRSLGGRLDTCAG